jgi:phage-related tail protein
MSDSKVFMLPENGYGNNNGFLGGWGGGILGFLLGLFFGNNGMFGNGFGGGNGAGTAYLGNMISNDNGRDLLMQAITNNGEMSRAAISQLATTLNQDFNQVNSAVQAINSSLCNIANQQGLTSLQVINAIQSGNTALGNQLCQCCCEMRQQMAQNAAADQLAICQQTNTLQNGANANTQAILSKIDAVEDSRKDREITALTAKVAQLESQNFTTAALQQAVAPILGQLSALNQDVEAIKRCQPATITLPNNVYTAVPTLIANAGADFIASYWANRTSQATSGTTGGATVA